MSHRLSQRIFALLLAAGTLGALPALADHSPDHRGAPDSTRREKRIDHFVAKMEKELKLSKDQAGKIRAILRRDPVGPPQDGAGIHPREIHDQVIAQLRSGETDSAALASAFEERLAAMRARHAAMISKFAAIHAVLTPEQRKKAADLLEKRRAKMEKRFKHAHGDGDFHHP